MEDRQQENKNIYSHGPYQGGDWKRTQEDSKKTLSFTVTKIRNQKTEEHLRETDGFWDVVQNAVSTGNYDSLNRQVQDVIDDTVEGVTQVGSAIYEAGGEWIRKARDGAAKNPPALYAKNPPGQVSGTLMMVAGYGMTGFFGFCTALSAAGSFFLHLGASGTITTVLFGLFTAAGFALGFAGSRIRRLVRHFRYYVRYLGGKAYCDIRDMARDLGQSEANIRKDLKKMIEKKMFLQGHLDRKETCLIVTDEAYNQYLITQKQADERMISEQKQRERIGGLPEDCREILAEGREYIAYIAQCNEDIPGEEMSEKLYRLEKIITRIFDEVEKNPSIAPDLRKFMNYYLPTTRKLLDAYREMEHEQFKGENIAKTRREIEDTMDTINGAFENLLDSFFKERALDISSDISVLNTMLAQEGLKDDGLRAGADRKRS